MVVRRSMVAVLVLALMAAVGLAASAAEIPKASLPALLTSAGQSPDAFMIKVLCDREKIKVSYDALGEVNRLTGVKTLILAIGGSAKGLGAAGIDENEELDRIERLLAKAKEAKMFVVGIHIGGEARRGPLSAKFVNLTSPRCNYLIIKDDGNQDGYFTKLGAEKKIPVTIIKETLELSGVLKQLLAGK